MSNNAPIMVTHDLRMVRFVDRVIQMVMVGRQITIQTRSSAGADSSLMRLAAQTMR
jgi:ABC-type lipoprotein export system ATPase subunit